MKRPEIAGFSLQIKLSFQARVDKTKWGVNDPVGTLCGQCHPGVAEHTCYHCAGVPKNTVKIGTFGTPRKL